MKKKLIVSVLGVLTGSTMLSFIPESERLKVLFVVLIATWLVGLQENELAKVFATFLDATMIGATFVLICNPWKQLAGEIAVVTLWITSIIATIIIGRYHQGEKGK